MSKKSSDEGLIPSQKQSLTELAQKVDLVEIPKDIIKDVPGLSLELTAYYSDKVKTASLGERIRFIAMTKLMDKLEAGEEELSSNQLMRMSEIISNTENEFIKTMNSKDSSVNVTVATQVNLPEHGGITIHSEVKSEQEMKDLLEKEGIDTSPVIDITPDPLTEK